MAWGKTSYFPSPSPRFACLIKHTTHSPHSYSVVPFPVPHKTHTARHPQASTLSRSSRDLTPLPPCPLLFPPPPVGSFPPLPLRHDPNLPTLRYSSHNEASVLRRAPDNATTAPAPPPSCRQGRRWYCSPLVRQRRDWARSAAWCGVQNPNFAAETSAPCECAWVFAFVPPVAAGSGGPSRTRSAVGVYREGREGQVERGT